MERSGSRKVTITVSVDWEGEHLRNILDLKVLRQQIGQNIPFTHFICPSYFIDSDKFTKTRIREVILPHDEVGLHIHPLKKLIRSIRGVDFKTEFNFYKASVAAVKEYVSRGGRDRGLFSRQFVSGRGVPLGVYSREEIKKIISYSKELLAKNLPDFQISGFRCGGWMLNDVILQCLEEHDFEYDSSAVPPEFFSQGYTRNHSGNGLDCYGYDNGIFTEYMQRLWGHERQDIGFLRNRGFRKIFAEDRITPITQPFLLNKIIEMPNNGGMSDFVSFERLSEILLKAIEESDSTNTSFILNVGCHQEGSVENKMALLEFLKWIRSERYDVRFLTVHQAQSEFVKENTKTKIFADGRANKQFPHPKC